METKKIKTIKANKTKTKSKKRNSEVIYSYSNNSTLNKPNAAGSQDDSNSSDLDIRNEKISLDKECKKYFIKLFEFRIQPQSFFMTLWEQFIYNFFKRSKTKRSSNNANYKKKLFYLMDKCEAKIEDYFDFINILESIQEAKILKEIILDEHQKYLVNLYKRPLIYYDMPNGQWSDSVQQDNRIKSDSSLANDKVNIYTSLDVLFNQADAQHQKNRIYEDTPPSLKINENFINFIRKAE